MKSFYCIIVFVFLLSGCADTPNNVIMSINKGQCILSNTDGSPSNNPTTAPYCMAVTLQNNNTGQNANNVQVTSSGITLSYNAIGESGIVQTISSSICDPVASGGVCPTGTNQIGNIQIYDPSNCATQQGSQVTTLMAGGGTCRFYLQITNESYAVGSYPITITYNYTNANQNYSISTNVSEDVSLYSGGSQGVFTYSGGVWNSGLGGLVSTNNVNSMIHDTYGNVYFNSGNLVYMYNGLQLNTLGTAFSSSVTVINSLAIDNNNNLIAGTDKGLYFYNIINSNAWSELSGISGNVIGVAYGGNTIESNIIYGITPNKAYTCIESILPSLSLSCNEITSVGTPSKFYNNSLLVGSGAQLYVGTNVANVYNNGIWNSYTLNPLISNIAYISSLAMFDTILYLGVDSVVGSSFYVCNLLSCIPQISSSNNGISGNIASITVDGAGYLYGVGNNLSSSDINPVNGGYLGVFLNNGNPTSIWQGISGGTGTLSTVSSVSSLSY